MQIIIDLSHDNIDVVQAVFAAYHANTPCAETAQAPLVIGTSAARLGSGDIVRMASALANDLTAQPAEAKPKRGRKPRPDASFTTGESEPTEPPVVVPPPPAPAAETYEQLLQWISGQLMANTLDAGKLEAARKAVNCETLFELSQKPELIPAMRKALES